MKFLAIPTTQLSDATQDFQTARQQAEEMIDRYGKQLGSVTIIAFYERGGLEYTSPIWFDPAPQKPNPNATYEGTLEGSDLSGENASFNGEPSPRRASARD